MTDFSYQLYSSRKFPPLSDTLPMLAGLGYAQVEGYGALYADPAKVAELADALAKTGLAMPTAHFSLDLLENDSARALEIARQLGIKTIFAPHLAADQRPADAAGWAAFGKRLARAGEPIWAAGLKFGWHNHDFEFRPVEGHFPQDLILAGDPRLVAELDVAWVVRGGQDPLEWLAKYADRIDAVHIKDIAAPGDCADEDGWADVGHGTMDWAGLLTACRATKAQYFVMEHDNPSDHVRFATRSLASVKSY